MMLHSGAESVRLINVDDLVPLYENSFDDADALKDFKAYRGKWEVRDGKVYGKLSDVQSGSASELYEVETEKGKILIPAIPVFVKKIDLEKGIGIEAIEGMFA